MSSHLVGVTVYLHPETLKKLRKKMRSSVNHSLSDHIREILKKTVE